MEQVGHWWNLGHPLHGQSWEDEVAMSTQGVPECDDLPDFARWHLASSDRGLLLMRELWREQVELVRQGLDPIGVARESGDDELIRVPALQADVDQDEGMRLFSLGLEERMAEMAQRKPGQYARAR
jgi:hypothetical protein